MAMMKKRFEGKVAIVTASTQGIGYSIAERLGLEGASIVISSRKQENVDEAVEKLKSKGIEVFGVVCHVSNAQHRKNLIDQTIQKRHCSKNNADDNGRWRDIVGIDESMDVTSDDEEHYEIATSDDEDLSDDGTSVLAQQVL